MKIPFVDLKTQYQALKPDILKRIEAVLEHGGFINGPEVAELETKLAEFTGAKYALTCASGTDALTIPMMALGIKPGDEVITTAFSFIATAETIILAGATPVFIDIEKDTFNMDVRQIEKMITPKTKAIAPVSLYGQVGDMQEINEIAAKHNLWVIEDAAQSFGARYKNQRSCHTSLVGGTSFFPAKPLGCYGDGGAIFTDDEKLFKVMKEVREHGSESRYHHTRLGMNGRLDTLQCAILLSKLTRYEWEITQRQKIAAKYNAAFSQIKQDGFSIPVVRKDRDSVWAQYTLALDNRAVFQKKLTDLGIPTSVHYPRTMPDQPWYEGKFKTGDIKVARWAADHVISLPMSADLSDSAQDQIIDAVLKSLG